MDEVEVPTFLCKEEKIVEVMYTRWGEVALGEWRLLDQSATVALTEDVDRVVFELPTGCFDIRSMGFAGGSVSIRPTPDTGARNEQHPSPCQRPHGYEEALREASADESPSNR
jgi:hypothetical protein